MADEFWPVFHDDLPEVGSRDSGGFMLKPDDRSGHQQPPQDEEQRLEPLETFSVADFAGKAVPEQEFLDARHMFPARNVTLLQGDGGSGKSLLAMQLCMAVVSRSTWLGISVRHGGALYVSAEDDKTQNHIRAAEIAQAEGLDLAAMSGFRIACLAGKDATLATEDRKGRLSVTSLFKRLELTLANFQPQVSVLDNLADVFGGNEISRSQAKQFIGMLRGLAIRFDCCILLLGHPSLTGLNNGSGTSGSTAWSNSVRSRLYLYRPGDQDADEKVRVLDIMKANYGPRGNPMNLKWDMGRFICTDRPERAGSSIGKADRAERVFMKLMRAGLERGQTFSPSLSARNYPPTLFAASNEREGINKREFERAMHVLQDRGDIKTVVRHPGKSREKTLLVIADENG
ncbi:AAA family ATPase [Rhizobium phaseoli]|uniref:AAA family ATPase n=1 Tax=Rhizobium phaseoli TaxID=396 RepID=UPI00030A5AE1|nr:AAA family ATPase [Rhizobium phaseoli]KKZ89369.1 RepA family protein [Rhizobium phaseoli Ch24-10]